MKKYLLYFGSFMMLFGSFMSGPVYSEELPTPETLYEEVKAELEKGLALWYPRSIDPRGGYHSIFGRDWSLQPYKTKGIVQQSRMIWTAAEVALRHPAKKGEYQQYAKHGFLFLRDFMWDKEFGGFYWEVKTEGAPLSDAQSEMKHAYGQAFAIYALANFYKLTQDPAVLQLAQDAYHWMEKNGHDNQYKGYVEAFYRDGRPMLAPPADRPEIIKGKTNELLGCKSMNSHLHLLEAWTVLYEVWPDETLRIRLVELLEIMRDVVPTWPGAMRQFFRNDWTPAATYVSFGHDIENTFLMEEAELALGNPSLAKTNLVGKALVDHSLEFGWDEKYGGFYHEGATFGEAADKKKVWWVQAEGLNTLLLMHEHYGKENPKYYRHFVEQWRFIQAAILDDVYGGWDSAANEDGSGPRDLAKAHLWKTAYHEIRALLNVVDRLENMR